MFIKYCNNVQLLNILCWSYFGCRSRAVVRLAFLVRMEIKESEEIVGVTDGMVSLEKKDFQAIWVDVECLDLQVMKEGQVV